RAGAQQARALIWLYRAERGWNGSTEQSEGGTALPSRARVERTENRPVEGVLYPRSGTRSPWSIVGNPVNEGQMSPESAQEALIIGPEDAVQDLGKRHIVGVISGGEVILGGERKGSAIQRARRP